ncbi:MAG: dihydrofolate reductase [Bacilli bacterium]
MINLSLIAAIGKNNELGKNNTLIWHLKDDLKFFKETTNGKTIVMGYNTFMSLPKLLPNRNHIILTSKNIQINGATICHSKEEILNIIKEIKEEVFIIGGESIYKLFLNDVNNMYLTEIESEFDADVFFPKFNKDEFIQEILGENVNDNIKFQHVKYRRKEK